MAITRIIGFQNFNPPPTGFYSDDMSSVANLPFKVTHGRFKVETIRDRVWLVAKPAGNSYGVSPVVTVPLVAVYGDYTTDSEVTEYVFGVRFVFTTPDDSYTRVPTDALWLTVNPPSSALQRISLFNKSEYENYARPVELYFEAKVNTELHVVERWLDGVRLSDVGLDLAYTENVDRMEIQLGEISTDSRKTPQFAFNDFYFMVNTEHLMDDTPSSRLGPVTVEKLTPAMITLPASWSSDSELTPSEVLSTTPITQDHLSYPALTSNDVGETATVTFEPPPVANGVIPYVEIMAYAHRDYGDAAALKTSLSHGSHATTPRTARLEPSHLRTGPDAIRITELYRNLDGEPLTEASLGELVLNVSAAVPGINND